MSTISCCADHPPPEVETISSASSLINVFRPQTFSRLVTKAFAASCVQEYLVAGCHRLTLRLAQKRVQALTSKGNNVSEV